MEEPTNKIFLHKINQLPQEIQSSIAFLRIGEFLLVSKTLVGHASPIKSLSIEENKVKIELCEDKTDYCNIEEKWDIHTGQLIYSYKESTRMTRANNKRVGHYIAHTILKPKNSKKLPLYFNLNTPELNTDGTILTFMKDTLTIPQSDLISRAYDAIKTGCMFTIYANSEDGKVFLSFDKNVRIDLLYKLNITLRIKS